MSADPCDSLVHAMPLYGMDRGFVIQSKHIYLSPTQTENKKNHLQLTWVQNTVDTSVNADMYVTFESFVFSEQGDQTPVKMGGLGNPVFLGASVAVSSEFCVQNNFKAAS